MDSTEICLDDDLLDPTGEVPRTLVPPRRMPAGTIAPPPAGPSIAEADLGLEASYRQQGRWPELVELLLERSEVVEGVAQQIEILGDVARIYEHELGDEDGAYCVLQAALKLDPGHAHTARELERLAGATDRWQELLYDSTSLVEELEREDRRAAADLWMTMSRWYEQLADLERATHAVKQALRLEPSHPGSSSVVALRVLAPHYAQTGQIDKYVAALEALLVATPSADVATRVELCCALGQACETKLRDRDRAIAAYSAALACEPDEVRALGALGRLYEQADELARAVEVMTRLVQLTEDEREQVALYTRIGRLHYAELGDAEAAEVNLSRALALEPGHLPAMQALIEQYSDRGDWLKAAQMMVRAERSAPVVTDKVRLLCDAAAIYQHRLHQDDPARQLYAAVIALDPEHVEAARPLAELSFRDQQWAELSPVVEMLCRKLGPSQAGPRELHELHRRAAMCAEALGDDKASLRHYEAAHELDPTSLPTQLARAELLFRTGEWRSARQAYQAILAQHRHGQSEDVLVRAYSRLGIACQALGDRAKALEALDRALELDPMHREALEAVVELRSAQHDWDAVVHAKRSLLATASPAERARLLDQIGSICRDKLASPQKAAAAYLEALEGAPDDHRLLQCLLDLYTETKQWRKAVETIERFVALERDPFRKGIYLHTAATVYRDELKTLDEAVACYDRALDSFFATPELLDDQRLPRALRSFEAIDAVLTAQRDWRGQERAYRAMIQRLPGAGSPRFQRLCVSLLDGLGEIYRSRLKQYREAAEVLDAAQQLDPHGELRPDSSHRAELLAELYLVAGPDHADKAIEQHTSMLRHEPYKYDSYQALARIYADTHQHDKRWCVCSTLAFLHRADPDELQFHAQHRPRGLARARHGMTPETWARLACCDENRYISAILGACRDGVAAMKAFPHRDFGVRREDRRELHGDQLMFSKLFLYVAQALNVPLPDVYLIDDSKSIDIQLANAIEKHELCPSFMVRPHLLHGKTEREIAFLAARRLAFMRPEYYLRLLLPTHTELSVVLLSAIVLLQPSFPVPANLVATVQQYLPKMKKRLPHHALEQLGLVVQRYLQGTSKIDLATWSHAVDAASHRAGFVMCGDLEVSARMIAAEPVVVGGPRIKDKLKELVLFSISEGFFAVRAQLGLTIPG